MGLPKHFFWSTTQAVSSAFDTFDQERGEAETNGAAYFQSCMRINGNSAGSVFDVSSSALSDFWVDVAVEQLGAPSSDRPIIILAGPTSDLFRIATVNTSEHWKAEYWDGSAWVQVGATQTTTLTDACKLTIDIVLDGTNGHWIVKRNETTVINSGVTDTIHTGDTMLATVELRAAGTSSSGDLYAWCLMVHDEDTTKLYAHEGDPTADGFYTDMTGGNYSDLAAQGNTTSVTYDADGEHQSFDCAAIPAGLSGGAVEGVMIIGGAEPNLVGAGPTFWLHCFGRLSSTDYRIPGAYQTDLATSDYTFTFRVDLNPSTGSPWADFAAVEAWEWGFVARNTA